MELIKKAEDGIHGLAKYRIPITVLIIGLIILLLPTGRTAPDYTDGENELCEVLHQIKGVGEIFSLVSDKGAVIVCDGADDPTVKLSIVNAVEAYTGLGCDKIQVFETEHEQGRAK